MTDTIIGDLKKNSLDTVRVQLREYKGRDYLDVRVYSDFGEGEEPKPTKKGIAIAVGSLPELRALLEQAEAKAAELGLIEAEKLGGYLAAGRSAA